MTQATEPQYIVAMIDNEGWPSALEWLIGEVFDNEELDQLIYDAYQAYGILNGYEKQIKLLCEELGVDWYV